MKEAVSKLIMKQNRGSYSKLHQIEIDQRKI